MASITQDIRNLVKFSNLSRPLYLTYRRKVTAHWSTLDNVYFCCTQKTGSQWFRAVFNDPIFRAATGFDVLPYMGGLEHRATAFARPFPLHTLVAHLYINYEAYRSIPKPQSYVAFFILRDPRDCIVSWYFSMLHSHPLGFGQVEAIRRELLECSKEEGLHREVSRLAKLGYFDTQRSWVTSQDPNARVFRYEDFAADNERFLSELLQYLNVKLSDGELVQLVERNAFSKLSGGRAQGQENVHNHYRKGVSGDWQDHLTQAHLDHFYELTGDTLEILGYER